MVDVGTFLSENMEGKDNIGSLGMDERII